MYSELTYILCIVGSAVIMQVLSMLRVMEPHYILKPTTISYYISALLPQAG